MDTFLEEWFNRSKSEIHLTVFMPCLNEENRVVGALENVFAAAERTKTRVEVLVFDDGSTDRTSERVRSFQATYPERTVRLITLTRNRGLGRNFIDGAFLGKGMYYRTVAGDNYEFPEAHDAIMRSLGVADIVVPIYRDIRGRTTFRRALSATYTRLVNVLSGTSLRYYNGFAAYRRWHVMRFAIESSGFGFQAELTTRLIGEGASYKEIELPATAQPGSKALRLRNFVSVAHSLLRILARRVSRKWR